MNFYWFYVFQLNLVLSVAIGEIGPGYELISDTVAKKPWRRNDTLTSAKESFWNKTDEWQDIFSDGGISASFYIDYIKIWAI